MAAPEEHPRDAFDDFNDVLEAGFMRIVEALEAKGLSPSEVESQAAKLNLEALDTSAPMFADGWWSDSQDHLSELREYAADFRERLRVHWGNGLDYYDLIVAIVDDIGRRCISRSQDLLEIDALFDLLVQLNGQALRVAREIGVLLAAGFPLGALALGRTLYELSVRMIVLADFGRMPGHEDLAQRYLDHEHVVNGRDAEVFQRDAHALGYEPFEEADLAEIRGLREEAMKRHGPNFKQPYGWAAGLPGIPFGRRFDELETLAETSHLRSYYMWASHFVHGDAKALRLNTVERGGSSAVMTDATNQGLADPANHALLSLNRIVVTMVVASGPDAGELLMLRALAVLVDRAQDAFVEGMNAVDAEEERLQTELRAEGRAMTPYGIVDLDGGLD